MMPRLRLLLDANISPETAIFLRSFGFDVKSLIEDGLGGLEDAIVARIAEKEKRILITFDLDFGEIYYFTAKKAFSVVILRLDDQRIEEVNRVLNGFFKKYNAMLKKQRRPMFIINETDIRITN